jgi:hypothetical protein
MPSIDTSGANGDRDLERRVRLLESGVFLQSASITKGRVRVGGTAVLLVDSQGGLTVAGRLNGDGTISWTGVAGFGGALNLTGTYTGVGVFNQNGPWNLTGAGGITADVNSTGNWTQTGVYTLSNGGKFVIAGALPMTIGVVGGRPGISFPGGLLSSAADRITMENGQALLGAAAASAVLLFGANGVLANATGVNVATTATTTSPANVFITTGGYLQRVSSAEKYKLAIEDMPLPTPLRSLSPKSWIDAGDAERAATLVGKPRPYTEAQQAVSDATTDLRRVPGVIAEEVFAAGGAAFVTYDEHDQVAGVAYDRLGLTIALDAQARITELEATVAKQGELLAELGRRLDALER